MASTAVLERLASCAALGRLGTVLTQQERDELHAYAVHTLSNEAARAPLLKGILQCLVDLSPEDELQPLLVKLLWQLGQSNSGVEVRVDQPPGSTPPVGVLLLGFAGANMGMLKLTAKTYQALWPQWRVVTTVAIGLQGEAAAAAERKQIDAVAAALADCGKIVLHSMSNNGFGLWTKIARQLPELAVAV